MKFNEKLTKLRKMEGLSQEELGYRLNVTRQTVSKWELGQTTPEMDKLIEIGKIFNISVDDLLNDSEVQSAKTVINEKDTVSTPKENIQEQANQETITEENVKENITNKENVNSYTAPKDDKNKREMYIMIVFGILFVITLALVISKGYEMISEKFDVLNPKEKVEQIDEVEETQMANNSNKVTNKVQENKETNSVNELDKTNTILQSNKTNTVKETSNTIEQSNVSNTTKKQETTSTSQQSSTSSTTQSQGTTSSSQQSSTSGTTQSQGTTSSNQQSSTTTQNQGTQSQVQQPSTTTPSIETPSSSQQPSTSVPTPPSSSNFNKEFELKKFNSVIEMYAGSSSGFHVKSLLDQIITKNKTEARKITVNACGVETQDETTIRNLKANFGDFDNYEVILDYDGEGFVTKVRIQK